MEDPNEHAENIVRTLENDRAWRRANSQMFLMQIADDLWRTMPDDEALVVYNIQLDAAPWWGMDVLDCLERVLRERPAWVVDALVQGSQRGEWLGPADLSGPYFSWLEEQADLMREAVATAKRGSSG